MSKRPLDFLFVAIQILLLCIYIIKPQFISNELDNLFQFTGSVLMGFGLLIVLMGLWQLRAQLSPFPSPKAGGDLISEGVFKFIRHPIYSGILFIAFGWAIYLVDFDRMLYSLALLIFFTVKANYEEGRLSQHFQGYEDYKSRTGRFLPYSRGADSKESAPIVNQTNSDIEESEQADDEDQVKDQDQ
jgi:protein-S-isoprenylcysteine O-methyltransferase Ste14